MKNLIKLLGFLFVLVAISGCYVGEEPAFVYPEYHEYHGPIVHYYDRDDYYHHDNGWHEGWHEGHGHGHGHDKH